MENDDICQVKWDFEEATKNCNNLLLTHPCPDEIKSIFNRPERLNPENRFFDMKKMICDSPTNANK